MIAGIIGATGYVGAELVRLLQGHPNITSLALSSVSFEGQRMDAIYPNLLRRVSTLLIPPEAALEEAQVLFVALPSGVGESYAKSCMEKGIPCIDLSADFRFDDDEATFRSWYGKPFVYPELRTRSVYGLPELNREKIKALRASGPVIIGNPGCYPTAASLGAYPALALGLAGRGTIIVDAASGITGGGREASRAYHYPECADALAPYKVGCHRHTPEISRNFTCMRAGDGKQSRESLSLIFTPHLAPMNRGILSTTYIPLSDAWQLTLPKTSSPRPPAPEVLDLGALICSRYAAFYRDEPFVRVLPAGCIAATNRVRQSNYCDISVHLDQTGSTLIVVTAIDNMVKGAAGQAVQNMNIIFGFDEEAGLGAIPAAF
ncbi:MAG: N-acetyl-gamma-glutamyl-phosphate reductase [Treponema sp.]|jgi:N-acetyl-gamma-glutamyl-phosphate reductase|nr:N-acetyl-gamma-glutamyl-phosphate reductase [Treponema sp.]